MRSALLAVLTLGLALGAPAAQAQSNRYLEAGLPAVSRDWSGPDYERAVQILSSGKIALPRFADPQGAALLRRMTSTENFALHHNKSVPLQARMEDYLKLYQGAASLLKLYYAEPAIGGGAPHQELAAFLAFLLHGSALGIELTDEFLPTIPKDDRYETRMAGLKQMSSGVTQVFQGAEETLAERQLLSADDLSVILRAMESTLPRIKKAFPADVRVELRKKLEEDKARFTGQEDLQRLDAMIRELSV
ncbi:MAG: hypothetical protein ACJ76N_05165 [Thermoanaerobaculia bacterium]